MMFAHSPPDSCNQASVWLQLGTPACTVNRIDQASPLRSTASAISMSFVQSCMTTSDYRCDCWSDCKLPACLSPPHPTHQPCHRWAHSLRPTHAGSVARLRRSIGKVSHLDCLCLTSLEPFRYSTRCSVSTAHVTIQQITPLRSSTAQSFDLLVCVRVRECQSRLRLAESRRLSCDGALLCRWLCYPG